MCLNTNGSKLYSSKYWPVSLPTPRSWLPSIQIHILPVCSWLRHNLSAKLKLSAASRSSKLSPRHITISGSSNSISFCNRCKVSIVSYGGTKTPDRRAKRSDFPRCKSDTHKTRSSDHHKTPDGRAINCTPKKEKKCPSSILAIHLLKLERQRILKHHPS